MITALSRTKSLFWLFLLLPAVACSADTDVKEEDCNTLVTETRSACMDVIRRGLDVSCDEYLMVIDMAMDQANGDLFDVGDDNHSAANSFCSIYVDKLREDRSEHEAGMSEKDQTDPGCAALAESFETQCTPGLGKEKLSDECRNLATIFGNSGSVSRLSQKQKCAIASM